MAKSIVMAVNHYNDPVVITKWSTNIGIAMT